RASGEAGTWRPFEWARCCGPDCQYHQSHQPHTVRRADGLGMRASVFAMADRPPERDDAGYDWLYGPAGKPDEATTRMPVQARPDSPPKATPAESSQPPVRQSSEPPADVSSEAPARSSEAQPTQVMPAAGASTQTPTGSESTRYAP